MNLVVIGGGYVGLVSGACLAEIGHRVTVVEKDAEKLAVIQGGGLPIHEPGLEIIFSNIADGSLTFSNGVHDHIQAADAVFIAVGTPSRHGDGHADISYIYAACEEVARNARDGLLVVVKSTVPVGTCRELQQFFSEVRPDINIMVASNPEFLREGTAIRDFLEPDRIIVGVDNPVSRELMRKIYAPLMMKSAEYLPMSLESAEMAKYASNSFLAMKVAYINEIADICEKVGADVSEVAKGMSYDKRIGSGFLNPGPGYGGSCFPKDTLAMVRIAQEVGVPSRLVEATVEANDIRKSLMSRRILGLIGPNPRGAKVAVLGLAFKAGTDDMRDAPSIPIISRLSSEGVSVYAYDPVAMPAARAVIGNGVAFCGDIETTISGADIVVVLTEWDEFRKLKLTDVAALMSGNVLVDLRNIYSPEDVAAAGLSYHSLGRRPVVVEDMTAELLPANQR